MRKLRENLEKNPNIELFGKISASLDLMIISDDVIEKSQLASKIENALLQYFGIDVLNI